MSVSLLALWVGMTLSLGTGGARIEAVSLDAWARVTTPGLIAFPWAASDLTDGFAVPGIVWTSTLAGPGLLEHEWTHVEQTRALGPVALVFAYALTAGYPFEDYRAGPDVWHPPPGPPRCPLITFEPPAGRLSLWACGPPRGPGSGPWR